MRRSLLTAGILFASLATLPLAAQEAGSAVADPTEVATEAVAEAATEAEAELEATPDPAEDAPAEEPPEELAPAEDPAAEADASEPEATEETASEVVEEPAEAEEAVADEEDEEVAAAGTDWAGLIERAPAFFALTHQAAVHLPIALWIFGALFVLIGAIVPSWRNQIPLACLIGGMVTSVAAAASGWWYAEYEYADEWAWGDIVDRDQMAESIIQHRWLAVALVLASLILSVIALVSQAKSSRGLGIIWRVGLLLLAAGVAYEGHLGGEVRFGDGFLEEAFQEWVAPEE